MPSVRPPDIIVSGLGVTSAIGRGKQAFAAALFAGEHGFAVMQRPGRQLDTRFIGAEIAALGRIERLPENLLRSTSFTAQVALATIGEAWVDAELDRVDGRRIGLIVGGSNLQQRELMLAQARCAGQLQFLRPSYGVAVFDTDICGLCTSAFGIRGLAHTVGGASASGQLAVIEAAEAVMSGRVDACIAVGALMDLSYWECQGFRAMGAMGSTRHAQAPEQACRPFDEARDGFIFGECCAAVVVERAGARAPGHQRPYARLSGWSTYLDANRNPDPSLAGEVAAIHGALAHAGLGPGDIQYVNPHGSGSAAGDVTELQALRQCGLRHAAINATKSITGHGLTAAGAVEVVATLLQFEAQALHPSRNLVNPIDDGFDWVVERRPIGDFQHSLNLSFGFGGINTALCMSRLE